MSTKILIVIFLQIGFIITLNSQVTKEWVRKYSSPNCATTQGIAIATDPKGNIYVGGANVDTTDYPEDLTFGFTVIKYNSDGVFQWEQIYNGPGKMDNCRYLAVDKSGNVYASGMSEGNGTSLDFLTIKYNTDGVRQWVQRYDGETHEDDYISDMKIDDFGNVFVTGMGQGEEKYDTDDQGRSFITIKYDSTGVQKWINKYNHTNTLNPGRDWPYGMAIDNAGNIYVTGYTVGIEGTLSFIEQCATVKYNNAGDLLWVQRYSINNISGISISPTAIAVNTSGDVFVTGACSYQPSTGVDYFTIKYSSSGVLQWENVYSGPDNGEDVPTSIATDHNNVYVTGRSMGSTTDFDYATVKYNYSGVNQWVKRYNGPVNGEDIPYSLKVDTGGVYLTGSSSRAIGDGPTDFVTIKYDSFGNLKWLERYTGDLTDQCGGASLALNSSGDVYVTGYNFDSTKTSIATIKYSQKPVTSLQTITDFTDGFQLSQNYPNPFLTTTNIQYTIPVVSFVSLKIYDLLGKEVRKLVNEPKEPGTYEVTLEASELEGGIYIYQIMAGGFKDAKKLVVIK